MIKAKFQTKLIFVIILQNDEISLERPSCTFLKAQLVQGGHLLKGRLLFARQGFPFGGALPLKVDEVDGFSGINGFELFVHERGEVVISALGVDRLTPRSHPKFYCF